jgi:hypothetical protein
MCPALDQCCRCFAIESAAASAVLVLRSDAAVEEFCSNAFSIGQASNYLTKSSPNSVFTPICGSPHGQQSAQIMSGSTASGASVASVDENWTDSGWIAHVADDGDDDAFVASYKIDLAGGCLPSSFAHTVEMHTARIAFH